MSKEEKVLRVAIEGLQEQVKTLDCSIQQLNRTLENLSDILASERKAAANANHSNPEDIERRLRKVEDFILREREMKRRSAAEFYRGNTDD